MRALDLYNEFKLDKDTALKKYQDREIPVSGRVSDFVSNDYLVLNDKIRCRFDSPFFPSHASRGQSVDLSGFVTGFDVHVVLEHCALKGF